MEYKILTVSREYGSGGARIASTIAQELGWHLLDEALINAIAKAAHVEPSAVQAYDERVDSWLHRMNRAALRSTTLAAGVPANETDFFDADSTAELALDVIEEAYAAGNAVIVGRGSQCILAGRTGVFRVFVYAPESQRLSRVQLRRSTDVTLSDILAVDAERARYLRRHYGREWNDPHMYDLMISSCRGEHIVASTILHAMRF